MSFVITNNVHYYDLTWDITFILVPFSENDKMPTAKFFLIFYFLSCLRNH